MPSPVEVDYLDGKYVVNEQEPATIAEVVELLGEEAVRKSAIDDNRYRNKYPRVYKKVSEAIALTFPRAVKEEKTNKDGTVKKILISTMDHIREYDKSGHEAEAKLAELFPRIANEEPLFVKGERAGGGGKVSAGALDASNGFFAEGPDKVEAVCGFIESQVPGYKVGRDGDGEATPESVARGIQALNKKMEQDAKKAAAAGLAGLKTA